LRPSDLAQGSGEGILAAQVGLLDPMQEQVHRGEQVGQRLFLDASDVGLELAPLLNRLNLRAHVL